MKENMLKHPVKLYKKLRIMYLRRDRKGYLKYRLHFRYTRKDLEVIIGNIKR